MLQRRASDTPSRHRAGEPDQDGGVIWVPPLWTERRPGWLERLLDWWHVATDRWWTGR
jgi:hypothetical protein